MDDFLGKITQHAMNYAIRAGIGITASYTLRQTSRLLKTVDNSTDYQELQALQERLNSKIRIVSPAIDLIELISARGNTTLESAVILTKGLRWDIQALGVRLAKAATAEESSRRKKTNSKVAHEVEIHLIVKDIKDLLVRIEDAVPLINLAITTSGASLSTTLPASVSPSRLLQASTFLTAGDTQYSMNPTGPIQVGPAFTLSLYMLFAGHSYRVHDSDSMRDTTWKEVIHKARVKLMRIPLQQVQEQVFPVLESIKNDGKENPILTGEGRQNEYAYHIEMIEDLEDDRVHTFDDDEAQPGPYGDVQLAGIRDFLPIYQISKIFYADTGKILNIGSQGEANNPVLLLKRDINALPPRRMMEEGEKGNEWYDEPTEEPEALDGAVSDTSGTEEGDSQDDIDQQLRRESSIPRIEEITHERELIKDRAWRLPADLDPEWMALEVYTETEDSSSEDGLDINDDSAYISHRPSSSGEEPTEENLAEDLARLNLKSNPSLPSPAQQLAKSSSFPKISTPKPSPPLGPIRSSLSLLEMLIRLTALQQFQQASHLSIPDELLTFFLEESSTTGAGGDGEERRQTRREARQKVGFDPYDESPVKRRGEDYQYQYQNQGQGQDGYAYSRGGTPYEDYDQNDGYPPGSPRWSREQSQSMPPQGTPEPWLLRSREGSGSRKGSPVVRPSSPVSPYRPQRKAARPLDRVQAERGTGKGSPLGRGVSVGTDSTLGTSPGSPTLV
ncbi:RanGTP-binding protein-domain-containing protein [Rhexocercosporidium sp. MPI-PUGE-AT-0058]|nr:RanGTP-binding protein-domain-containing protein [Rhexocercosporidium sp. MPI-PUGE-AT-0058]